MPFHVVAEEKLRIHNIIIPHLVRKNKGSMDEKARETIDTS